jgi:hypothetical protein
MPPYRFGGAPRRSPARAPGSYGFLMIVDHCAHPGVSSDPLSRLGSPENLNLSVCSVLLSRLGGSEEALRWLARVPDPVRARWMAYRTNGCVTGARSWQPRTTACPGLRRHGGAAGGGWPRPRRVPGWRARRPPRRSRWPCPARRSTTPRQRRARSAPLPRRPRLAHRPHPRLPRLPRRRCRRRPGRQWLPQGRRDG